MVNDPVNAIDPTGLTTYFGCDYGVEGFENCGWKYRGDGFHSSGGGGSLRWTEFEWNVLVTKAHAVSVLSFSESLSDDCSGDIEALSGISSSLSGATITAEGLANALAGAHVQNSLTSAEPYRSLFAPGSEAYQTVMNSPSLSSATVGTVFKNSPATTAMGQQGGGNIYIRPSVFSDNSTFYNAALLVHESIHNLGLDDDQIRQALGLTEKDCGTATECITKRLEKDCFPAPQPVLLP